MISAETPPPIQAPGRPVITIFEDEPEAREFFLRALEGQYTVLTYSRITDGLEALERSDLVVGDWSISGGGGEALLRYLDGMVDPPLLTVVTTLSIFDRRLQAVRHRGIPILSKPVSLLELNTHLASVLASLTASGTA